MMKRLPNHPRPALEVEDLVVRFGSTVAVDRVDWSVPEGGLTALLGPSGCGKTSLLRAVAGFEVPAGGRIRIAGEEVFASGRWVAPEDRRIGMVFQQGALFPQMTVWQNVLYGLKGRSEAEARAAGALELVGLLRRKEHFPDELSGGEQQRVALARALAPSPRLVLLDEPFAGLDASLRQRVREEVRTILERAGMTAILVTHDQEEALSVADRVAVMQAGRILQMGDPETIYRRPSSVEVARFVGESHLLPCHVREGQVQSPMGPARCQAPDGPGLLLLRPEDLAMMPECHGQGMHGEIVRRQFFGHDLLDEVRLDNGEIVRIRLLSTTCFPLHSRVFVRLRHPEVQVFPLKERGSVTHERATSPATATASAGRSTGSS